MEQILQYVWKHRLFQNELKTTEGVAINIIDVGILNTDSGPDFFNAKVKVGDKVWVGNIEIHKYSSEWFKHKHHEDNAYNSVILHIVEFADKEVYNKNALNIPQCEITFPKSIQENINFLIDTDTPVPCCNRIREIDSFYLQSWLDCLIIERLERKVGDLERIFKRYNNSWSHVFYILLCRSMGFGLNSDAFERLAHSISINSILKQANNIKQIEAILFGQAGLLEDNSITDEYYKSLTKEYKFLKNKYGLIPLNKEIFKLLRVRPSSSIYIRIAQLASLLQNIQGLPRKVLESSDIGQLRLLLHVNASTYWQYHSSFSKEETPKNKYIGDNSLDILIINTIVPFLFAYGNKNGKDEYINKAMNILYELKAENNSIIRLFSNFGLKAKNASDSQALIQLKKEYCDKKKCLFCRIGFRFLAIQKI